MSVRFVAEVSSNHNRDLQRALAFIDTAAGIGCDAVKFQLFRVNELFAPEILHKSERHRRRRDWELPVEMLPALAERCSQQNIDFACTPFYLKAVTHLKPYVAFYKIASYELLWNDLLRACAQTGKPVVLATGMATLDEIAGAVKVMRETAPATSLTLLHCVSGYPTPPEQANLAAIETLRQAFSVDVGWSDHTVSPAAIFRAIYRWNASMIEFHLDLEGNGEEFSGGHCWLPRQIQSVIRTVRVGESADGTGQKVPAAAELTDRDWRADPSDGLRPMMFLRKTWSP